MRGLSDFGLAFLFFGLLQTSAEGEALHLKGVLKTARELSPEMQLMQLEAQAKRRAAQSSYGKILPEFGVEGGARSSREKEKRNDHFYYGYARYELSLEEIYTFKAALSRKQLADREQALVRSRIERLVADHFFEAALLQERIKLKEEDLKLTDLQMVSAKRRVEGGLATQTDILEFQLHQQELNNDLEILRSELAMHLRELQRLSGMPSIVEMLSVDFPLPPEPLSTESELWDSVARNSLELTTARAEVEIARSEKGVSRGAWLPRLSAEGQYGKLVETDFFESKKNSWEIVGKVTIPLFSGTSSLRDFQAKSYEADRAQINLAQAEMKTRNTLQTILEKIAKWRARLAGERTNVETADAYYKAVMSEYRRGVKNSPDVASATDKLFEAKERLLEANKELSSTYLDLLTLQGRVLED